MQNLSRFSVIPSALLAILSSGCSVEEGDTRTVEQESLVYFSTLGEYRSIDGEGNNQSNPEWGAHGDHLFRLTAPRYADGVSAPAGANRPSPRAISNAVVAQSGSVPNTFEATDMFWLWGQFLDHDITIVEITGENFPIPVPAGDAFFDPGNTGQQTISFTRSTFDMLAGVRQHPNEITAFIDASNVYGSTDSFASSLRTNDGTGRLATSAGNLLPVGPDGFFVAGDVRSNEHIFLTAMHTLWVREHNYWADFFTANGQDGESAYQLARAMVGAEMQAITYNEFLPLLVGEGALSEYSGYNANTNPQMAQVFSVAAYRLGHSMLNSQLQRVDASGQSIPAGPILLRDAFFNPSEVAASGGITPLLRGMAAQQAQDIDEKIVDDVRNFLFGPPGAGGFDLAALNLQRGRDHGLPSLAEARSDLGLPAINSFADISSNPTIQANLASVYASPADVDLWVGGLAEDNVPGSQLGMTFQAIIVDQFTRVRDGDRFFYENLPQSMRLQAEHTKLSTVIRRNTEATVSDLRHEVMRLAPDAEGDLFGFENAALWQVISGSVSQNSSYFTDGSSSLNASGTNVVLQSNQPFSAGELGGADELLIDVFVPVDIPQTYWAGLVQTYLDCPAAGLNSDFAGQYELTLLPRGQFNTAKIALPSNVKNQLTQNPGASCSIRVELVTNGSGTPYALDRLRAR